MTAKRALITGANSGMAGVFACRQRGHDRFRFAVDRRPEYLGFPTGVSGDDRLRNRKSNFRPLLLDRDDEIRSEKTE